MTTHEAIPEDFHEKTTMKNLGDRSGDAPASKGPSVASQSVARSPVHKRQAAEPEDCRSGALEDRSPTNRDICVPFEGQDCASHGSRRKHRRKQRGGKHHKKWKPYNKLTWEEKKELEERETVRATKKREDRFASGQPMAPYNTTQFLMEQHEPSDPEFIHEGEENNQNRTSKGDGSGSVDSSDEYYYDSPSNEDIFLEKEFTETYENYHAERLNTMSKEELVKEYLELESRVEGLERQLRGSENSPPSKDGIARNLDIAIPDQLSNLKGVQDGAATLERHSISAELQRLRTENSKLAEENKKLRGEK